MARSFCAASDLQSHNGVWASLKNGEPEKENGEPIIATAVEIAAHYATSIQTKIDNNDSPCF